MAEKPNSNTSQGKANIAEPTTTGAQRAGLPDVNGSPETDKWSESANPLKETPTPFSGMREVK